MNTVKDQRRSSKGSQSNKTEMLRSAQLDNSIGTHALVGDVFELTLVFYHQVATAAG